MAAERDQVILLTIKYYLFRVFVRFTSVHLSKVIVFPVTNVAR